MNTSHTKGPWHVEEHHGMICVAAKRHLSLCSVGYDSAAAHPDEVTSGERADNKANAQLIAAAPELLEACRLLMQWAEAYQTRSGVESSSRKADLEIARSAIAKATKGQN